MFQLFVRAFSDSLRVFDTTLLAIGLTVLGALVTAGIVFAVRGWAELKKHVVENIVIVFAGAVATWLLVFLVILVQLPAKMLAESNTNLSKVIQEKKQQSIAINSLADKLQNQDGQISGLKLRIKGTEQAGAHVVTRTLPTPEEPRKCWLYTFWSQPNPHVSGSVIATDAVIYCSKRTENPVVVSMEFDGEFIEGNAVPLGVGVFPSGGGRDRNSKTFTAFLGVPLLAFQPVVVEVQAKSQLRAVRGVLQAQE